MPVKRVPSFDMVRKNRSPLLSMNVTALRSTVHVRPFCARCLFFQHVLSSPTHGCTKRPSRVHLCSVAVSAIVIRNLPVARFLCSVARVPSSTGCLLVLPLNFKRLADTERLRMGRRSQPLAHVDFRSASLEMHFVHIRLHQ